MEQIAAESSKLEGLEKRQTRLVLRAPFSGVIAEMDDTLQIHQWVNHVTPLCFIIDPSVAEIKGIIAGNALNRIEVGQKALFYLEDPFFPKLTASISRIDWGNIKSLDLAYLASPYGGEIAVKRDRDGTIVPETTAYAIRLHNVSSAVSKQEIRGTIRVTGKLVSVAQRIYEAVFSVMIRESGF